MADQIDAIIRLRRGPDGERRNIAFQSGEVGYSTDIKRAFIGDGVTKGGSLLGNQNTLGLLPNPSAIQYDLFYNNSTCITYMLSNNAGPDNIANYTRITPIADELSLIYRNGLMSINPIYFKNVDTGYVRLSGDTMKTGSFLTLGAIPTLAMHATPKMYVDNALTALSAKVVNYINTGDGNPNGGFVHLSGDTMKTGAFLTLGATPTLTMHAVTKGFLEDKYIAKPTVVTNGNALVYNTSQGWVAGFITNDFIDTSVREVGGSVTVAVLDSNNIIVINSASNCSCTVPDDTSGHRIGTQIIVIQKGAGKVTFGAAAGVSLQANSSRFTTIGQWSGAVLIKIASNQWFLGGDVTT